MNENIFILGASGFSAEVTEYIEDNNTRLQEQILINGYFDINDQDYKRYDFLYPFLGSEKEYNFIDKPNIIIAISNPNIRKRLYDYFKGQDFLFPDFIHSSCFISKKAKIGEGAIICPFVTITSNAKIGVNFQANIYSYIAHDCTIGDNVTFAPAVKCNGNIEIGDNVYIGTGVIIKQGKNNKPLKIGKNATIGAGAYVTKDIPDGMTVFGNPAIEFTKENLKRRS